MNIGLANLSIRYKSLIAIFLLSAIGIVSAVISWVAIGSIERKLHDVTEVYAPMLRLAGETMHYAAETDKDAVEVLANSDQAKIARWVKEFEARCAGMQRQSRSKTMRSIRSTARRRWQVCLGTASICWSSTTWARRAAIARCGPMV